MSQWLYKARSRHDGVTIPRIWVAFALSLLLHTAVMWKWLPQIHLPSLDETKRDEAGGSLVVRLAPPPRPPAPATPPSAPALQVPPSPVREARPVARPQPAPPVMALNRPAPEAPAVPPPTPPVPVPAPARPPAAGDFASDIEARRRARNESAPPAPPAPPATMPSVPQVVEDEKERRNRIIAGNLAPRRQAFGYDPSKGGGVFEIKRIGAADAEFIFVGWDKTIRRNTMQLIEVQKGNNSDTRIAVIRKMITIIREHEQEDFLWESRRLDRNVMLSARLRDTAGLEAFLMREFFPEDPRAR